jgi:hypothetical protein
MQRLGQDMSTLACNYQVSSAGRGDELWARSMVGYDVQDECKVSTIVVWIR